MILHALLGAAVTDTSLPADEPARCDALVALAALCVSMALARLERLPFPESLAAAGGHGYRPALGEAVLVGSKKVRGIARYVGPTDFSEGEWIGVELSGPFGKNDGTVQGVRYFDCESNHGLFLRQKLLSKAKDHPDALRLDPLSPHGLASKRQSITEAMQRISGDLEGLSHEEPILTAIGRLSRNDLIERLWALADHDRSGSLDKEEFVRTMLCLHEEIDEESARAMFDRLHGAVREEECEADYLSPDRDRINFGFFKELLDNEEGLEISDARLRDAVEAMETQTVGLCPLPGARASYVCGGLLRPGRAARGWRPVKRAGRRSSLNGSAPLVVIAGPPAAGRAAQCEKIKTKYGYVHVPVGQILRRHVADGTALGLQARDCVDAGRLVPDELVVGLVAARLGEPDVKARGCLLDGFPRSEGQARALLDFGMIVDRLVVLQVPDEISVERTSGRRLDPEAGEIDHLDFRPPASELVPLLVHRSGDTEDAVRARLEAYHSQIGAVLPYFTDVVVRVDGTKEPDEVFELVSAGLEGL